MVLTNPLFSSLVLTCVTSRFTPNRWGGGGYLKVHQQVGSLIDWYNIQVRFNPIYLNCLNFSYVQFYNRELILYFTRLVLRNCYH